LDELPLHRIDPCEVGSHVVVAASLMGTKPKAARGIGMAGSCSTEVNNGGQILLLLERDLANLSRSHRLCDATVEPSRSQLDGMAWYDTLVEAVEPA
jgi:hypothetical protein